MKEEYKVENACPMCFLDVGNTALSRVDNKLKICRFCGVAEGKDPIAVKVTQEEMKRKGHIDYGCYLKEERQSSHE